MTLLKETLRPFGEKLKSNFVVGFNAKKEAEVALANFNTVIVEGKSRDEAGNRSFGEIAENLRSWDEEFNKGKSVFSANYALGLYEGKVRILDKTGLPVAKKISPEERQGKALSGWLKAEEFLLGAPENSLALIISPKGPSGLIVHGGGFDYVDTYIQVVGKINGEIVFFTIRTYAEVESARVLYAQLVSEFKTESVTPETGKTHYEEVSNIVGAPVKLSSNGNPILNNGLEGFVGNLLSNSNNLEPNIFGEDKNSSGIYNEFLGRQNRLKLDFKKQALVEELKEFYFSILNQLHISKVKEFLAEKINSILLKFTLLERGEISDYKATLTYSQQQRAFGHMKTMHGCSGSGSTANTGSDIELIQSLGGFRLGAISSESEGWHLGECGKCGAGKKDPKVEISCGLCRSCIKNIKEMEKLGLTT